MTQIGYTTLFLLMTLNCFGQSHKVWYDTSIIYLGNKSYAFVKKNIDPDTIIKTDSSGVITTKIVNYDMGWVPADSTFKRTDIFGHYPPDESWAEIDSAFNITPHTLYKHENIYYPKIQSAYIVDSVNVDSFKRLSIDILNMSLKVNKSKENIGGFKFIIVKPDSSVDIYKADTINSYLLNTIIKHLNHLTYLIMMPDNNTYDYYDKMFFSMDENCIAWYIK